MDNSADKSSEVSDAENAEIDAQVTAAKNQSNTQPTLEESYADMTRLMHKRLSDGYWDGRDKYDAAIQNFDRLIKPEIAKASNILYSHTDNETGEFVGADDPIKQKLLQEHPIAENVDTVGERNTYIVQKLIDNTPSLKGFSIDDAVNLASGEENEMAVRIKFKDADPDILLATAYTLIDNHIENLEQSHPDFYQEHENIDFLDMASTSVLYKAESNRDYTNWEGDKLEDIATAIANNPSIAEKLSLIRSPDNIHTTEEIIQQYQIRQKLTDEIGEVYAKAHGLSNFNKDDIHFSYKSLDEYMGGAAQATAYATTLGVKDDEIIISSYHPIADLVRNRSLYAETSDSNSAMIFLKTTIEELQHTTDNIYADKLLNGELSTEHPAFEHASLNVLNSTNYTYSSESDDLYKSQYAERTAKTTADNMAFEILFQIDDKTNNTEDHINEANSQSNTSSFINDQNIVEQPALTRFKF